MKPEKVYHKKKEERGPLLFLRIMRRLFYPLFLTVLGLLALGAGFLAILYHHPLSLKLIQPYLSYTTGLAPFDLSLSWTMEKGFNLAIDGLSLPKAHLSFKTANILWNPFGQKSLHAQGVTLVVKSSHTHQELDFNQLKTLFAIPISLKNVHILNEKGQTLMRDLEITLDKGLLNLSQNKKAIGQFKLHWDPDSLAVAGTFQDFPIPLPILIQDGQNGFFQGKIAWSTKGRFSLDIHSQHALNFPKNGLIIKAIQLHVEGKSFDQWTGAGSLEMPGVGFSFHVHTTPKIFAVTLKAKKGFDQKAFLAAWPKTLSPMGHLWVMEHVQKVHIEDFKLEINKQAGHPFTIQSSFSFKKMVLLLDQPLGLLTEIAGTSNLTEKGMIFHVTQGVLAKQQIKKGQIRLAPFEGETQFHGDIDLKGPMEAFSNVLVRLGGNASVPLKNMKGDVMSHVKIHFPLIPTLKPSDIQVTLKGQGHNVRWTLPIGNKQLLMVTPQMTFSKTPSGLLHVQGKGTIQGHKIHWVWSSNEIMSFVGVVPVDDLSVFSQGPKTLSPYFKGLVSVKGKITPKEKVMVFDLSKVEGALPFLQWKKPVGGALFMEIKEKGGVYDLKLSGGLTGESQFDSNRDIFKGSFVLNQAMVMYHYQDNAHRIFIDAKEMTLPSLSSETKKPESKERPPLQSPQTVSIQGQIQTLNTNPVIFSNLKFELNALTKPNRGWHEWEDWIWQPSQIFSEIQNVSSKKKEKNKNYVSLDIQPRKDNKNLCLIQGIVSHGGLLFEAFGIHDPSPRGPCYLLIKQETYGYQGDVSLDKVKTYSSFMTKLVAMISPTLFTEFFSSGLTFRVKSHFIYKKDTLFLDDFLAESVNLGLALKGQVDCTKWTADLKGVVIPSYLLNTFLGHFPVVGWIFGGRNGVFSSEITVNGPLKDPLIHLNPLSFFKVGFIKNMLEAPKEKKAHL